MAQTATAPITKETLWYKDAVIYQLHVKSFADSNGDGIGDFRRLEQKLGYLRDLGVTAVWLLPFYPSPLRDDGYDIADYYGVHPDYGTLRDFKRFLRKAHSMNLKVITELVINHTSDQHPWFQRARQARPGTTRRNFYVWSDTPDRFNEARIIFQDFETSNWAWDNEARAYYWHRFYSHQPDLNFDNPKVQKEIIKVIDFWLGMGVDGLRLDAVPYLFEREGTNCENLPETHHFLKKLRSHVDERFPQAMLLAEANQWPEDAVSYFGEGDECHMAFHFPIMPRLFMSLWMEDRFPVMDILEQTPPIPDSCQWALFLRNHDELTLEMVTDEERDYMYRVYAKDRQARINLGIRRRLVPLLGKNRRLVELMNVLLFSLPGTPIIYYGDEIGMGDNYFLGDRNGVRTPMQWSPDRNAGFSMANPQKLYLPLILDPDYHYEVVNVENQEHNLSSLLWWTRRVLSTRRQYRAFSRGGTSFLRPKNHKVIVFIRECEGESILVVVNLSRFAQVVELDLSDYAGCSPVEVMSGAGFPIIKKDEPYVLTMGFHDYFWFLIKEEEERDAYQAKPQDLPQLQLGTTWNNRLPGKFLESLSSVLPAYFRNARWFGGKNRTMRRTVIQEDILLPGEEGRHHILLVRVTFTEGLSENYTLPLAVALGEQGHRIQEQSPESIITRMDYRGETGYLIDGSYDDTFRRDLLAFQSRRHRTRTREGSFFSRPSTQLRSMLPEGEWKTSLLRADQSNSSYLLNDALFFKLFRKVEEGINPEVELLSHLTEKTRFAHVPRYGGTLVYRHPKKGDFYLGLLQNQVPNHGTAWTFMLEQVDLFLDYLLSLGPEQQPDFPSGKPLLDLRGESRGYHELLGEFCSEMIWLLGCRTAEMHLAFSASPKDGAFAPEPFSKLYQRAMYQSMRGLARKTLLALGDIQGHLDREVGELAQQAMDQEDAILGRMARILEHRIDSSKIRIHGDYHLGQVLFTGKDFVIIDFEGEPARPVSERRLKRSPFRDIAGMIRSFHYASQTVLLKRQSMLAVESDELQRWASQWYRLAGAIFLDAYLETADRSIFIPDDKNSLAVLLDAFILEKAVYEVGYEMNNRPDWLAVPLKGIGQLLSAEPQGGNDHDRQ
ncbi:MAG: maltose alpha-D-glucosyltransferase [Synergistales bacterium]|nr:maltose alpha-D-glucosyltransferase [Synergistales bacterium]